MEEYKHIVEFNRENLNLETQVLQEKKVKFLFIHLLKSIEKHFDAWTNRYLPFVLFSERQTVQVVASFLLDIEFHPSAESFYPKTQGKQINVRKFNEFLKQCCTMKVIIMETDEVTKYKQ